LGSIAGALLRQPLRWDPAELRSLASDDWPGVFIARAIIVRRFRVARRVGANCSAMATNDEGQLTPSAPAR
jgi:hypothetical protein